MNDLHFEYKKDTGHNHYIDIEETHCVESYDTRVMTDMTRNEIVSILDHSEMFWAIRIENLNELSLENNEPSQTRFYTKEYIEWLENKISKL
jgi:hypothetical protein